MEEKVWATLHVGELYSIYLPDGEWKWTAEDSWAAEVNDQVVLRIEHYEEEDLFEVEENLFQEGYHYEEDAVTLVKQEEGRTSKVKIGVNGGGCDHGGSVLRGIFQWEYGRAAQFPGRGV